MSEIRGSAGAASDLDEASLDEQRAAVVAQAAALGLTVIDPSGKMPGPVRLRLTGRSADLETALALFDGRGIRLDDITQQRVTRGLGVSRTATLNLAHPANGTPTDEADPPVRGGEVRVALHGAATDVEIVLTVLRELSQLSGVTVPTWDGNSVTVRQSLTVDAHDLARRRAAAIVDEE